MNKRQVGRPPVEDLRKPRSFKATDAEWAKIKELAKSKGMTAGEYLRNCALNKKG